MADLKEQCICMKFYFKHRKTAPEMHEMHETAFGDNAMGRTGILFIHIVFFIIMYSW
jgi:hypothetical protein